MLEVLKDGYKVVIRGRMNSGLATQADVGGCNILLDQHGLLKTPAKLDITSSSALDTGAGTGARTIVIVGLGPTKRYQTEVVTLTGTTIVQTALTWYRVFGLRVLTTGTGSKNAGDIYVVKTGTGGTYTTPGVPGTFTIASALCKSIATTNQGVTCFYTTPNYEKGLWKLMRLTLSTRGYAGTALIQIEDHAAGTPVYKEFYIDYPAGFTSTVDLSEFGFVFGPDTDIRVTANGESAGVFVSAVLEIEEINPIW